jgi:hypothetical protein
MPEQLARSDGEAVPDGRANAGNKDVGAERTLDEIIDTYARE